MSSDSEPKPRKRRALKVILSIVVILAIVIYLVPFIVSTGAVKDVLVKKVNEAVAPLSLDLASLNVSWAKGIALNGVEFTDPGMAMIVRCDEVIVARSLLSLAKAGMAVSADPENLGLAFDQVTGDYKVDNLHLSMVSPRGTEFTVLSDLVLDIGRASTSEPLGITASVKSGGGGSLALDLSAESLLQISGDIDFNAFDLEPFNRFVGANPDVPYWTGQLHGDLNAAMDSDGNINGKGALSFADLVLRGGALGKDKPTFSKLDLSFDVQQDGQRYELKALNVDSPVVKASVGSVVTVDLEESIVTPSSVKGSVKADLVALAEMLPNTLQIRDGLQMKSGQVYVSGDYTFSSDTHRVSSDMRVKELSATISNQVVRLDQPVTARIDGSMGPKGIEFTTLDLTSSFATIKGQGTLADLRANIRADLAALLAEAQKFSDLQNIDAGGTLSGDIRAQSRSAERFHLTAGLSAENLVIKGVTPRPILQKSVTLNAATDMSVNPDYSPASFDSASLTLITDELKLNSSADSLAFGEGEGPLDRLKLKNAKLATTCSLGEVLERVYSVLEASEDPAMIAGRMSASGQASITDGVLTLPEFKLVFGPLNLTQKGQTTVVTKTDSTITAVVSADQSLARLKNFTLSSEFTSLGAVGEINLADTTMPLQVRGRMNNNMPAISRLLQDLTQQDIEMAGSATNDFDFAMPLAAKEGVKPVSVIQAHVKLDVDAVRYKGMRAGSLSLPVSLEKGILDTHLKGRLEGGVIDVAPSVNLNPEIPILSIPDNSQVMDNVNLTTDMLNRNFDKVLPMLNGCVVSTGKVSVLLKSFSMPLDPEHIDKMAFVGQLHMSSVIMEPGGQLLGVLQKLDVDIKPVQIAKQDVQFYTSENRIYNSPLVFSTGGSYITMKGSVGFDNSFDYLVEIPIMPKHVKNDKVYKYLEGKSIPLRIMGQIGEELDYTSIAKAFFKELATFVAQAGYEAAKESGLDQLREKAEEKGVDPALIETGEELIKGLEGLFRKR